MKILQKKPKSDFVILNLSDPQMNAFEWKEDSIIWYVDGKPVYKATEDISKTPGRIMMNVWNVHDDYAFWAGKFTGENLPVTAEYKYVAYGNNS